MSWDAIRDALVTRFEALFPTAKVHGRQRYTREPSTSDKFKELFSDTAKDLLHSVIVSRVRRLPQQQTDGRLVRVHHEVEIAYLMGLLDSCDSEDDFQDAVEEICRNLETGDRTLGGVAQTHGLPEARSIGASMFSDVLVHDARIFLVIEEVV